MPKRFTYWFSYFLETLLNKNEAKKCKNPNCSQLRNYWHDSNCKWVTKNKKGK